MEKKAKLLEIHPSEFPKAEYLFREAVAKHLETDDMYWRLEDMGKDVLANIMDRLDKLHDKISETKLERLARTHEEWKTYKEGLYAARFERGKAKARFIQAERYWATLQSGLAYKRDEMHHMHGGPG